MIARELTPGRTFGVTLNDGDDFMYNLSQICRAKSIQQGYVHFLGAFSTAEIVGTCTRPTDPDAPVWDKVHLDGVEALGFGTLAWNAEADDIEPHIHVTLGEKKRAANGYTSHLNSAVVAFTAEMLITEINTPTMTRRRNPHLHNVPLLVFGA